MACCTVGTARDLGCLPSASDSEAAFKIVHRLPVPVSAYRFQKTLKKRKLSPDDYEPNGELCLCVCVCVCVCVSLAFISMCGVLPDLTMCVCVCVCVHRCCRS